MNATTDGRHWLAWDDDDETIDDAVRVDGADARAAAAAWAERSDVDSADYSIVRGDEARVRVVAADAPDGLSWLVKVTGETVAHYSGAVLAEGPLP